MTEIKRIQAGSLTLNLARGRERFDDLLGLASRENQKRGFLFVSKVLGKHVPVRPSLMRAVYDELAQQCGLQSNAFVIGMAETATGLGAGVADSLARANRHLDVFYQHTTRHALHGHEEWFTLCESHSHAVDHILYRPNKAVYKGICACQHLVLVDDEMTTGKTLLQLAKGVIERVPSIASVRIVTLVSWLNEHCLQAFAELPVPVEFVELIKGEFEFQPDPNFSASLPEGVDRGICRDDSRDDLGRTGIKMPYQLSGSEVHLPETTGASVVVGTGEYLYQPFLIAEQLERTRDVVFQSTTRSPILKGDAIARKTYFEVGENRIHYIYNLPPDREAVVLCESEALAQKNGLLNGRQKDLA